MSETICRACRVGWRLLPDDCFCGFCGAPAQRARITLHSAALVSAQEELPTALVAWRDAPEQVPEIILYEDELDNARVGLVVTVADLSSRLLSLEPSATLKPRDGTD